MDTIWQALIHTPLWVYILFVYLVFIGIKASKTSVVSLWKMAIIPTIFFIMSVETLINSFGINLFSAGVWLGSLIIGIVLGWMFVMRHDIRVDKDKYLLELPGTWTTLTLILIIFSSKYYFGYELAKDPNLLHQTNFEFSMLFVSGVCSGMFIGRFLHYFYRLKIEPHASLS